MANYETHSWASVVAFYQHAAGNGPSFAAMAELVNRLAESAYADGLHPATSHYMLRLFPDEVFDFGDDQIQVEHDGEAFAVRYVSAPRVRSHSVVPITSRWAKRSPDGLSAIERCVHHVGWITEQPRSRSRPAG